MNISTQASRASAAELEERRFLPEPSAARELQTMLL